ncbi:MAG: methyltransferase [Brooklawnia sp.]|uniref:class I SAM-dependent methyltransferase n=1 Tax=Brooklawnia sp. TaxID=2699740 RepID=UPI003C75AE78
MSHYFETPAARSQRHRVQASIWGRELEFVSAPGVFSAARLDPGTRVLLRSAPPPPAASRRLLDLGCGFGPIAIALALACPRARVDAIDVNDLALQLTRDNAELHQVADRVRTARPDELSPDDGYDEIWSNPPIRIGKAALHELLLTWLPRLRPGGTGWLVVGKNLGADSLQRWLTQQGWAVDRVASSKGFRVFRVQRNPTPSRVGTTDLPPA